MKAYKKDIWRTIKKERKRFFSILLIALLGVTAMTSLRAACSDLRYSADKFFDDQRLFDISVVSTLGLTEDDVVALSELSGVEVAEGGYGEKASLGGSEGGKSIEVKTLSARSINIPHILEGRLPNKTDEIAVTEKYLKDMNKSLGDSITIKENIAEAEDDEDEEEPNFVVTDYRIVGVVIDPMDVNTSEGATSFRAAAAADYTAFVCWDSVTSDVYSSVYLRLNGLSELDTYSDEYKERIAEVKHVIETTLKEKREQARYDSIIAEAESEIADAENEMNEEFAKADKEIADAWDKINDGKAELAKGRAELLANEEKMNKEFADARSEIAHNYAKLESGKAELAKGKAEIEDGKAQITAAKAELEKQEEAAYKQLDESKNQLIMGKAQAEKGYNTAKAQADRVAQGLGALWDKAAFDSYASGVRSVYMQVMGLEAQVSALKAQLASAQAGSSEYTALEAELNSKSAQLSKLKATLSSQLTDLNNTFMSGFAPKTEGAKAQIDMQIAALDKTAPDYEQKLMALNGQKAQLDVLSDSVPQLAQGLGQASASVAVIDSQLKELETQSAEVKEQFTKGYKQIADSENELDKAQTQLSDSEKELASGLKELKEGEKTLNAEEQKARALILEGYEKILDGLREIEEGEAELIKEEREYLDKKAEAIAEIEDAREKLRDIDTATWYIQDRTSLNSYVNINSDSSSIEALGTVFPVIFLIIAVLISLTTITRKVEEDRGLIGTYKALGFTNGEIRRKYTVYAVSASFIGGFLGDIMGFIVLPKIISVIFSAMYCLPEFYLKFDFVYGTLGIIVFVVSIGFATVFACANELRNTPAVLMRPKAPKAGSRVFLEYIPFVWNNFSFLNKVTARNLFRYKKRLIMTILGITGCTALLMCGFAVNDTVRGLVPKQYEQTYKYDVMTVSTDADNDELIYGLDENEMVDTYLNLKVDSIKLKAASGKEESVQLMVVPQGESIEPYIGLESIENKAVTLKDGEIYITENAANILGFKAGDTIKAQDINLKEADVRVTGIVKNYLGNNLYITQKTYEDLLGEYKPNAILVNLTDGCTDHKAFAQELSERTGVVSSVSIQSMKDDFSASFALVNMAVYILITLAAGLAFVVLFTLANTNISERTRELATIKVLGFYDREVHSYVNKESMILTSFGILLGLPCGRVLGEMLMNALKMPAVHFAVAIHPESYVYSAVMAVCFALFVNLMTNKVLNKINPVEALKSVE